MKEWLLDHPMRALLIVFLATLLVGAVWYSLDGGVSGQIRREDDRLA